MNRTGARLPQVQYIISLDGWRPRHAQAAAPPAPRVPQSPSRPLRAPGPVPCASSADGARSRACVPCPALAGRAAGCPQRGLTSFSVVWAIMSTSVDLINWLGNHPQIFINVTPWPVSARGFRERPRLGPIIASGIRVGSGTGAPSECPVGRRATVTARTAPAHWQEPPGLDSDSTRQAAAGRAAQRGLAALPGADGGDGQQVLAHYPSPH